MIPAAVLLACPNLAVPARLMYHVAQVESDANPYAIGVVGGRLLRQPASLDEAIATARSLEAQGYNFSVGVAQVNHANLRKYGLDTYEKAFSICGNLLAGSRILAQCYANAGGVWGNAFSCYYSGDFTTGYRDGYVQRVLASLSRGGAVEQSGETIGAVAPFPVLPSIDGGGRVHVRAAKPGSAAPGGAAWRIAIRTSVPDAAADAAAIAVTAKQSGPDPKAALQETSLNASAVVETKGIQSGWPASPMSSPTPIDAGTLTSAAPVQAAGTQDSNVFVPLVGDLKNPTRQSSMAKSQVSPTVVTPAPSPEDSSDAAFVF